MAAFLGMVFASEIHADSGPIAIPWLGEIEAGEAPPPLSVESLFSNSRYWAPVLSPSGNYLAVLHSQGDVDYVIAQEIGKTKLAPVVRIPEPDSRFARLWWANDDRLLVSLVGRSHTSVGVRARITRLFGVDRDGGNVRWLGRKWPRAGSQKIEVQFQDQILHLLPDDPQHVLIQLREASENDPSVKRMNVSTGRLRSAVARKRGIKLWFPDHDGEVRVGIGYQGTSKTIYARGDEDGSLEELTRFDMYEEDGFSFAGYSFDPDTLYVYADHDGRDALFEYSISNKKFGDLVYAHPEYDVAGLYFDL
ncbi:MAG: hypothetical protein GY946_32990, partial [bacterium]|nr:hypothetical protein [bacterium]